MSKLDNATRKVREKNSPTGETSLATTDIEKAAALKAGGMLVGDDEIMDLAAALASGEWEAPPQLFDLKEGDAVKGILEGEGVPASLPDPRTKEMKDVKTWILRSVEDKGVRISILGSAQLDRKLPGFIGDVVIIKRGGEIQTKGGGRVTEYLVAGPKRPEGARSWGRQPQLTDGRH